MTITRRLVIASGSATLAAGMLGIPAVAARDDKVFRLGSAFDHETFGDLLRWVSSKKATELVISPDELVIGNVGSRLVRETHRKLSPLELESVVRHVYGESGVGEIASGFILDPAHVVRLPGGVKRFRINLTADGAGIEISARELPAVSFA